jgi:glycosyltransferase involved in cell wall biosynthesis
MKPIGRILRETQDRTPWHILDLFAHERYQANLTQIDANFYSLMGKGIRTWNEKRSTIPDNFEYINSIPIDIDLDCIVSQNPFTHLPFCHEFNQSLNLPIIQIWHTDCVPQWGVEMIHQQQQLLDMCHHHVFITRYNQAAWGRGIFGVDNGTVIEHGIDLNLFKPNDQIERDNVIMSTCNDFINRDAEHGFKMWQYLVEDLPTNLWGDTPGLSVETNSLEQLVGEFQRSRIFLHTSMRSPLSMSLLEAAACGCAIVAAATCGIPDYFEHGNNALLFPPWKPELGRQYLEELINDEDMALQLGRNARQMAENYSVSKFTKGWTDLLEEIL